jgi:general secretion pathway protein G
MRPLNALRISGFTLVELLASVAIIGLLATVAVPMVQTTVKRQKERELRTALRELRQGIDAYKQATVSGKIILSPEDSGYPATLGVLVEGVDDATRPGTRLRFLRRIPRDPFQPAAVKPADTWGKRSFESSAESPQAGVDVYDVYSKSALTGLNSIPYREW